MFDGNLEDAAAEAEKILGTIAPGAICVAQEWDNRIDCVIRLPDGNVVGEMVSVSDLGETRIRATGERLRQRAAGQDVPLVNELRQPLRIIRRAED